MCDALEICKEMSYLYMQMFSGEVSVSEYNKRLSGLMARADILIRVKGIEKCEK